MCLSVGCGQAESPTSPSTVAVEPRSVVFSGTLAIGGSRFYSFTASQAGVTSLMLASLIRGGSSAPLSTSVGLGFGVPSGPDCATTIFVTTGPALTAQISESVQPGIYCARIADIGTLTEPVAFAIRMVVP